MKRLEPMGFDLAQCLRELSEFKDLLDSNDELSERKHILKFFRSRRQLASQICHVSLSIKSVDCLAFEFDIFGDFVCDVSIGDTTEGAYCFVEFEDAKRDSIFVKRPKKSTPEFSPKFEHGYSQIVDWFYKIDDLRKTHSLQARFGVSDLHYEGVLVIGRDKHLDEPELHRLRWRSRHLIVNSKTIICLTYDRLYQILSQKLEMLRNLAG